MTVRYVGNQPPELDPATTATFTAEKGEPVLYYSRTDENGNVQIVRLDQPLAPDRQP